MAFNIGGVPAATAPAAPGFNFATPSGGGSHASQPAPGGFGGFGGSISAFQTSGHQQPGATTNTGTPSPTLATVTIPSYNELFPGRSIWYKIDGLLRASSAIDVGSQEAILAGQELIYILDQSQQEDSIAQRLLMPQNKHSILETVQPDHAMRQRLAQHPLITLSIEQEDGSIQSEEATLAPNMLQDVCAISDDLQISEVAAICLYQQAAAAAAATGAPFRSKFVRDCLQTSTEVVESSSIPWMAREIYISQSPLLLRTSLTLLQHRLREGDDDRKKNPVSEATDALLKLGWIGNLIQLVRDYTKHVDHMLSTANAAAPSPSGHAPGTTAQPSSESSTHFWRHEVTLRTCVKERQLASECLFFVAYHVQLKADEIVSLIDSVQELTNGSVVLNPYTDVPDPFETFSATAVAPNFNPASAAPWFMQQQQQKEKDPLAWQRELATTAWKTGQPQLLRCFSTLLMAIVSALGDRAALMDRTTHAPNVFGIGNALLPPGSPSTDALAAIHSRLENCVIASWKRPEVLGILMAAYAMLLRSFPSAISSPRATGASIGGGIDVRKTWREAMEAPAELKSFTFARICLIPALRKQALSAGDDYTNAATSPHCDVAEFFLSLLAEFSSRYLDVLSGSGDRPISRAKWEQDAEDDLRLRRAHQEQQQSFRGQFPAWTDTTTAAELGNEVPAEVDLLGRPDCMDDVIAFATAVCCLGPDYALQFWTQESHVIGGDGEDSPRESVKLVPSRALRELEVQQEEDDSLRPTYLSFLAALALAKNPSGEQDGSGADAVHEMFSGGDNGVGTQKYPGWSLLVELLRWYIRQLNPQEYSITRGSVVTASSSGGSTAYYYFDQGIAGDGTGSESKDRAASGEATSQSKPQELGDANEFILLSHLALISNVAANSAAARAAIVTLNLPIRSPDGSEIVGQDSTLTVLFSLAVMPLSPEVRGAVFRTIARLISVNGLSEAETTEMRNSAIKGWELLESCQVVPISLLEQYPSLQDPSLQSTTGLSFPPSSTALALGKPGQLWIPADPRYAIVYEMEYIESSLGYYPSTEAFLQLLASLFAVGGFPSLLGQNWRVRSGCTPYVEYVVDYILPRATSQFERLPALPFRSTEDKKRLLALALEVVETVLTRYVVPTTILVSSPELPLEKLADELFKSTRKVASQVLGHLELGRVSTVRPHDDDIQLFLDDFRCAPFQIPNVKSASNATSQFFSAEQVNIAKSPIPRSKAPGFYVLAEMLSPVGYKLLNAVISPLLDRCVDSSSKLNADMLSMAYALYVSTPPTFFSAKEGARRAGPANARQSLLKSLRPATVSSDEVNCGERAILIALRILCATLAREDIFRQSVSSTPGQTSVVPVLRFTRKSLIPIAIELQLSKLSQLLVSSDAGTGIVSSIVDFIGFVSSNERIDTDVATAATAIVFYVERSLPQHQITELLRNGDSHRGGGGLARAFNTRLLAASAKPLSLSDVELLRFAFDRLLLELRTGSSSGVLTQVMFGLQTQDSDPSGQSSDGPRGILESIVGLLDGIDFTFGAISGDVASSCYEILHRLTKIKTGDPEICLALYTAERLRAVDFWKVNLVKICSSLLSTPHVATSKRNYHVIHSIAWLLKGLAGELHLLAGFSSSVVASCGFERLVAPRPGLYKSLCSALFADEGLIVQALRALPIERLPFSSVCATPLDEEAVVGAKESLHGSPEVVQSYVTINLATLMNNVKTKGLPIQEDGLRAWVEHWNHSVVRDCASAHLSDAIRVVVGSSATSGKDAAFQIQPGLAAGKKTMIHILKRTTLQGVPTTRTELPDDAFFTTACRNLALAARMVSSSVASQGVDNNITDESVDNAIVSNLIVRAIACSAAGGQSGPTSSRRNERIAILAGALVPVLREVPDQMLRDADHGYFFQAAVVLSKLACNVEVKRIPAVPSPEILVSRACLALISDILENSTAEEGFSGCRAVLTDTTASGSPCHLIQAIPLLDENIALLLQKFVGISPQVTDLLIASDILAALQAAADKYQEEEERFLASQAHNVHYGQIQTPSFLLGHFELMGALMASRAPSDRRFDVATKLVSVIQSYKSVFERLLRSFPVGGDTLYAMLRCMAQSNFILHAKAASMDSRTLVSQQQFGATEFLGTTYLHSQVARLTMHIAENPLPVRLLGAIPSRLNPSLLSSGVVVVSETSSKSWWDDQDTGSLANDVYGLAILGMDMLKFGLSLIRSSASLDEFSLSRALCRCTDAAIRIDAAIKSSRERWTAAICSNSEHEQLATLGFKINAAVEELLLVIIERVREIKQVQLTTSTGPNVDSFCKTIAFALDHTRLEFLNLGSSRSNARDENHIFLISELSRGLRKELERN